MAAPSPIFCVEYQRLKDRFSEAASEYLRLQSAQIAAILNGDPDTFQQQIHEAAMRKDEAKYAVIAHREAHHCGD